MELRSWLTFHSQMSSFAASNSYILNASCETFLLKNPICNILRPLCWKTGVLVTLQSFAGVGNKIFGCKNKTESFQTQVKYVLYFCCCCMNSSFSLLWPKWVGWDGDSWRKQTARLRATRGPLETRPGGRIQETGFYV